MQTKKLFWAGVIGLTLVVGVVFFLRSRSYPRWEGGRSTNLNDPRWKIVHDREKIDRAWQGRMPIDFYGKVVDEKGQPVEGALAKFSWTDLSAAGSTQSTARSDIQGLFSLVKVTGKALVVQVQKEGYHASRLDRYGFEFAWFSDEQFYQPDSGHPVVFHLQKHRDSEALVYREQEVKISVGQPQTVQLDANTRLQIELLSNPRPKEDHWAARVSVLNGGLQPATAEFPVEAPEAGYEDSLLIDANTPKPGTWVSIYEGGVFFLKTGPVFGRIEIRMISGKDWLRVTSWLNPKPGSRNLEFGPQKGQ